MSKFLKILAPAGAGAASMLTMAYVLADQFVVDIPAPIRGTMVQAANAQEADAPAAEETAAEPMEVAALTVPEGGFGLGREALPEEIAAWDVKVFPDGRGLPVGSGDVWTGEEVFVDQCASCHGDFAEGVGNWPVLAGGFGTLDRRDPVKTVGSYWEHLSTAYDYINRSMPFGNAGTLTPDETYAIVAYILYSNNMVEDDFVLSNENFTEVEMPNANGFVLDDRAELEYAQWSVEPCMSDCKDSVEITMHASVIDVTPEETAQEVAATPAAVEEAPAEAEMVVEDAAEVEVVQASADPALIAAGESAFRQCSACHQVGEGAANRTGPQLNGVVGRTIGSIDGFRYSNVMSDAHDAGAVWDQAALTALMTDPRGAYPGTKMAFRGVRNEEDIAAIIAYLGTFGAE
ncbi:MAG: c-type cytochrome [Octadecabacter sp.]|nr:c-type cytochrome [Octadecabacter sp.]